MEAPFSRTYPVDLTDDQAHALARRVRGGPPLAKLVTDPTIFVMAEMGIVPDAYDNLLAWLKEFAPECLDPQEEGLSSFARIFPHDGMRAEGVFNRLTDNELLVEVSGRKCYNSFGKKAGRRSNAEYVANLFGEPGKIPHASVLYHAKMTFFFGGIGRRVSHELIRHYVGADRDEEGSPSQESTRYTHHSGHFSVHPREVEGGGDAMAAFAINMNVVYRLYRDYIDSATQAFKKDTGREPAGMDRKRIYEAAAQLLPGSACTSFTWTTNPMALAKLFTERCDYAADLEIQRFAVKLRDLSYARWPNLFMATNPAVDR